MLWFAPQPQLLVNLKVRISKIGGFHCTLLCTPKRIGRSGPKPIALISSHKGRPWKFHYDRIIFTQVLALHIQNPFTGLSYKRVDESAQKLIRRNALYITKHTLKVLTRSVYPYARESSPKKQQTDIQTNRFSKITFLDVLMVVHPQFGLISNLIFLRDANASTARSTGHRSKITASYSSNKKLTMKGMFF